ncbi:hypothetical protein [Ferrovum myxofaciens]|uniref:hypothetical protein n=1 Tax=Ferrovum myxofaciens TaxID=416213 RepID=UPI0023576E35|nr:hypothetical protein [Ferrovum myxofaciens]MBU6994033.1 hypothetical protein [Ferrovum myxofaciens]
MSRQKPPKLADVVNGTPEFMDGFNVLKSALTEMRRRKKALEEDIKHLAALPTEQRQDIIYHDEDGTPIDGTFIMNAKAAAIVKYKEFIDRYTELVWAFDAEIARQLVLSGKFITGRKLGTKSATTEYLTELIRRAPTASSKELYTQALTEAGENHSPFTSNPNNDLIKPDGKPMGLKTFENTVSKLKKTGYLN